MYCGITDASQDIAVRPVNLVEYNAGRKGPNTIAHLHLCDRCRLEQFGIGQPPERLRDARRDGGLRSADVDQTARPAL
jgi:hypothetical protein